jgi:uncharacterized iron-regulated protein
MRKLVLLIPVTLAACATPPPFCPLPGQWIAPASLRTTSDPTPRAATQAVVLLGEQHDSAADHQWQLATITRLYAANPGLVLGFEMFPRAAQPLLDRWVAGQLSESDFLARTDWAHVWGFPPALYTPIFRFARDHHIPMLALNVSHRLVHLVAQKGWDAVPASEREGVGTAAAPSAAYRASLGEAMSGHGGPAMTQDRLHHFIEAQSVWDRAMAEGIAAQRARAPTRLVVALMGAGHVENRYGVPHQLESLGIASVVVMVPAHHVCTPFAVDYADVVYVD